MGCKSSSESGGLCYSHGVGRRCSLSWCSARAKKGGFCVFHSTEDRTPPFRKDIVPSDVTALPPLRTLSRIRTWWRRCYPLLTTDQMSKWSVSRLLHRRPTVVVRTHTLSRLCSISCTQPRSDQAKVDGFESRCHSHLAAIFKCIQFVISGDFAVAVRDSSFPVTVVSFCTQSLDCYVAKK